MTAFTRPFRSLSLYWGSIDQYNTLEFLNGAAGCVLALRAANCPLPMATRVTATPTAASTSTLVRAARPLTGLRFTSTGVAFEFDDIASDVPEPSSWAMLIAGFGLIGAAARRRRG